jgi:hypothetical protein
MRPKPEATDPGRPDWLAKTMIRPHLDNTAGLLRANGFVSSLGPLLVLQEVEHHRYSIFRAFHVYGPGTKVERSSGCIIDNSSQYLVRHDQLYEAVEKRGRTHVLRCRFRRGQRVTLQMPPLRGIRLEHPEFLEHLGASGILLYALCDSAPRELLFASSAELAKLLRLPKDAKQVFEVDDFEMPKGPLARSPDLVAMANALVENCPLPKLEGKVNSSWRHWLNEQLAYQVPGHRHGWDEPLQLMYADD